MTSSRGGAVSDRSGGGRVRSGDGRAAAPRRLHAFVALVATPVLAALLLAAFPALADEEPQHEEAERGALLYRIHCSNCHGPEGRGDGPMADVLKVAPRDLTRLAAGEGGTLPRERIRSSIDGRRAVSGHGHREMPVWGLAFQELGKDSDQEREVQARLDDLVAYLATLQEPEAE